MRRLLYCVGYALRFWPLFILNPIGRWVATHFPRTTSDGIEIIDTSLRGKTDERFRVDTVDALQLIKSFDPRRYHRIQREVKRIVNSENWQFASYSRSDKTCEIDYGRVVDRFDPDEREWYLWWYATTLIHESTHGAIYSRRIAYTSRLRARIEHLCHTEEKRFAKRADTAERQWSDALVGLFDESRWHSAWSMTRWRAIKQFLARIKEARESVAKETDGQNKK